MPTRVNNNLEGADSSIVCDLCHPNFKWHGEILTGYYLVELNNGTFVVMEKPCHKNNILIEFPSKPEPEPDDDSDAWNEWYKPFYGKNEPVLSLSNSYILIDTAVKEADYDPRKRPRFWLWLYDYAGKFLLQDD